MKVLKLKIKIYIKTKPPKLWVFLSTKKDKGVALLLIISPETKVFGIKMQKSESVSNSVMSNSLFVTL